MAQKALLDKKFGSQVQYGSVILLFDKSSGNIITAQVKPSPDSKVASWWTYLNASGSAKASYISVANWNQGSEEIIKTERQTYFKLDRLFWNRVPALFASVYKNVQAKGVTHPKLKSIMFSNFKLTATITATTRGGGSTITYEYNMKGELINEPTL